MDIINVKYARSHAGMRVTSSATPSCEDILGDRIEVSLVDTCRDAPSTGRLSNDENEHERSYEGGVGGTDGTGVRGQGERNTLLHSKVDEISAPAERRSAGKLTKGECARGSLSLSLSPSPLSLSSSPQPPAANPLLFLCCSPRDTVNLQSTRLTSDRGNGPAPSDCHFPAYIRTACFFSVRTLFLRSCS